MLRRQQALADFGEFALRSDDLGAILHEACRLVGDALGTKCSKILEIQHKEGVLLLRAGIGWAEGLVGRLTLPMDEPNSETFAIKAGRPIVAQDLRRDKRFTCPRFMKDAGVVALVNVPIFLPGGRVYGLLEVDDTQAHAFGDGDIQFLRTYATILGPVIDRLLTVRALHATEERFRLTVESALDYAIFLTDPEDRITDWLPGAEAVFGWGAQEAVGQPAALIFTPTDRETGQDLWETEVAARDGVAPDVRWHLRKNGQCVLIEGSTRALRDPDGTLQGFLKIGQDVTERRLAEDRQKVLVAELQHRTRNLMGVVRSIARASLRAGKDLEDFRARFEDRIEALARVQGLLSRLDEHERITFDELVRVEFAALEGGSKAVLQGPPGIRLRSSTVQILALALHELATNAIKYGALGQPQGRLSVTWRFEPSGEGALPWLHVDWEENDVMMPDRGPSPAGSGQGRVLIERALPYQLKARTSFTVGPHGIRCTMSVPVSESNLEPIGAEPLKQQLTLRDDVAQEGRSAG